MKYGSRLFLNDKLCYLAAYQKIKHNFLTETFQALIITRNQSSEYFFNNLFSIYFKIFVG